MPTPKPSPKPVTPVYEAPKLPELVCQTWEVQATVGNAMAVKLTWKIDGIAAGRLGAMSADSLAMAEGMGSLAQDPEDPWSMSFVAPAEWMGESYAHKLLASWAGLELGKDYNLGTKSVCNLIVKKPQVTIEELNDWCDSTKEVKKLQQRIVFEETESCDWGKNGNLQKRDRYYQARLERYRELMIPKGSYLCGVAITAPEQEIWYDDEIIWTLNNKIIMSSFNYSDRLPSKNGLVEYLWETNEQGQGLKATYYDLSTNDTIYCAGDEIEDENGDLFQPDLAPSTCNMPKTQTTGKFTMDMASETARRIGVESGVFFGDMVEADANESAGVTVGMIITGDDNVECKSSKIVIDFEVDYVQP